MAEPTITVTKASYWQPVALDTDGTPLHHGERMVETKPGVWADPVIAAAMDFLAPFVNSLLASD
jgi:hypothetical protein